MKRQRPPVSFKRRSHQKRSRSQRRYLIDTLEDRRMLATNVLLGSVDQFTGPADLNLDPARVEYAINFSQDDPDLTVNGVTFQHDRQTIPGATFGGPREVSPWQTTPDYGATADDNNLEQIMGDIRWAAAPGEQLSADLDVTPGRDYRLQLLISGNSPENRRWDIGIEGQLAVDEITSLGVSGTTYSVNRSTVYNYEFTAGDPVLNVVMGGANQAANDGGDRNAIWQGLVLTDITTFDFEWDGTGDGSSWGDPLNWVQDSGVPGAGDTVRFANTDVGQVDLGGVTRQVARVDFDNDSGTFELTGGTLAVDQLIQNGGGENIVSAIVNASATSLVGTVADGSLRLANTGNQLAADDTLTVVGGELIGVDGGTTSLGLAEVVLDGGMLTLDSGIVVPPALGGVTADLELWLDGSDLDADGSSVTGEPADGATVTIWRDKSGNGHHADNVEGDPSYVANSATAGGRPVINFDGNDQLYLTDDLSNFLGSDYSIITVARYTGGDNERIFSSKDHNWLFGFWGNADERWYAEGWIQQSGSANTDWHIHTGTMEGLADPLANFWKDGTQLTVNGTGSNNASPQYKPRRLTLGGWITNEYSRAEVAEVIVYDRLISAAERGNVEQYLALKYATEATDFSSANVTVLSDSTINMSPRTTQSSIGSVEIAGGANLSITGNGQELEVTGAVTLTGDGTISATSAEVHLSGGIDLGANTLTIDGSGDTLISTAAVTGSGGLTKSGSGTLTVETNNTYSGDTLINGGVLIARHANALGADSGDTLIDNAELRLEGNIAIPTGESLTMGSTLSSVGNNTWNGDITLTEDSNIVSTGGTLTINGEVDLAYSDLVVEGDGDTIINGDIVGTVGTATAPSLLSLSEFTTGDYSITADSQTFDARVDNDGGNSWLLVGRGRESWEFDADGQGLVANVNQGLGTPSAFAPAAYSSAIINDLLQDAGAGLGEVEIRLRRAQDPAGNSYQESRWQIQNQPSWVWNFDASYTVNYNILTGQQEGFQQTGTNTRDNNVLNQYERVFTWAWGGHNNQKGFSYGGSVSNGANNGTSFLWESGNENHAIPYTEVFIRLIDTPSNNLTKNGTGTLTVTGDNTYQGETFVNAGTLVVNGTSTGLGTSDGGTTVANGATLELSGNATVADDLSLASTGSPGQLGALTSTGGDNIVNGSVTATGDSLTIETTAGSLTVNGSIDLLVSDLTIDGNGDTILNGSIGGSGTPGTLTPYAIGAQVLGAAGYYSFDNVSGSTVINEGTTGAADNGAIGGTASVTDAGQGEIGQALQIGQGSTNRLLLGSNGVDIGSGGWTASLWFNGINAAGAWRTGLRGASNDHQIIVENGSTRLGVYDNANGGFRDSGYDVAPLLDGEWHHIVARGNAGGPTSADATTDFFVDGVLVGTSDRRSVTELTAIGNCTCNGQPFGNLLDEVALFQRPLTDTEIQLLSTASSFDVSSRVTNHVTKNGTGSLTLAGANNYDGDTTVNDGVLIAAHDNALGLPGFASSGPLAQVWQVGTDNGTNSEFAQESGSSNAAPGDPAVRDDDWYFAGSYPFPIGDLAANSLTNTFERALTNGDVTNRIHFNLTDDQLDDNFRLDVDVCCSNFGGGTGSGNIPFQVLVNGNQLHTELLTTNKLIQLEFNGADVGLTTGDNVVTLTRGPGGGWMQFDYVRLNAEPGVGGGDTVVAGGATLELSGGVAISGEELAAAGNGFAGMPGAVVSSAGANQWNGSVSAGGVETTLATATAADSLTISGNVVLNVANLIAEGDGEIEISGDISGLPDGINTPADIPNLPTGLHDFVIGGQVFQAYVDNDGSQSWLLIGRGRQGWEFDEDGQGDAASVTEGLGTPAAFAPAAYSNSIVNEFLDQVGVTMDTVEVRIERAADPTGASYQETRWRDFTTTDWTWVLSNANNSGGLSVTREIVAGAGAGALNAGANTSDFGANNAERIFTWAWSGHGNQRGFSYGTSVTNGANNATSYLWENGNENHAIPYTEVYLHMPDLSRLPETNEIIQRGNGQLVLSGDNVYEGETRVENGTLVAQSDTALGLGGFISEGSLASAWQVGTDNGSQGDFAQENGSSNPAPGDPATRDDDWYFAGDYPAPIGTLATDSPTNTFERALTGGDPTNRIHFNLTEDQLDDNFRLNVDVCCSNFGGGSIPFQVLFNGHELYSESLTTNGLISLDFNGLDVGATTGDNVVTLTRGPGGGWMQFDYVGLQAEPGRVVGGTTVSAGATLGLEGDIVIANEAIEIDGTGSSHPGALVNIDGDNTIAATATLTAAIASQGTIGIGSQAGTLTVDADIDLAFSKLVVDGSGNVTINGEIGSSRATVIEPRFEDYLLGNGSVPNLDTVAYWPLSETSLPTAVDVIGARNGSYDGFVTSDLNQPGAATGNNASAQFDGTNNQITVPHDAGLNTLFTNDYTVSFWMYKDSEAADWQRLIGKGQGNDRTVGIWEEAGAGKRILFQVYANGGNRQIFSTTTIEVGQWYHIVATKDGSDMRLFINGTEETTTQTLAGVPFTTSDPLTFGKGTNLHTFFPGRLDEISLHDRPLVAQEVSDLYNSRDGEGEYVANNQLMKMGSGSLTLTGANTYADGTTVTDGTLLATNIAGSATGPGNVDVSGSGILAGDGNLAGAVSVSGGGVVSPGSTLGESASLSTGSLAINATGISFGEITSTGNDTLVVTGTVDVTDANGALVLEDDFRPVNGQTFVLIDNDEADAIVGELSDGSGGNLAEGDSFVLTHLEGGITRQRRFTISYVGGDGNDLVITHGNRAPVAGDDTVGTNEDTLFDSLATSVLDNDSDDDNDDLSVTAINGNGAAIGAGFALPSGATLTMQSDGTFTYDPVADFSGTDSFVYTVSDGELTGTATVTIDIAPVADAPTLTVANASGDEDTAITLDIDAATVDIDGSETLDVTVAGIPVGATLTWNDGAAQSFTATAGSTSVTLTATAQAVLDTLAITPPLHSDVDFSLDITATANDSATLTSGPASDSTSVTQPLSVAVAPVADLVTLTLADIGGPDNENTAIGFPIAAALIDTDGSESITSVTISGLPATATLSAGTDNGGGNWTLTEAQLAGLTVTQDDGPNPAAMFTLTVVVETTDVDTESLAADSTAQTNDTLTYTIDNTPPVASISGPTSAVPGFAIDFNFAAVDPSATDQGDVFDYMIVWGDGNSTPLPAAAANGTVQHTYGVLGTFQVEITATDKDGEPTVVPGTFSIDLVPVALIGDDIYAGGTDGMSDRIIYYPAGDGVRVRYNNDTYPTDGTSFPVNSNTRLVAFGRGSNDQIIATGRIPAPAVFDGGDGNDYLASTDEDDTLTGGAGNDVILGGEGDNVLIGDDREGVVLAGNDRLEGRSGRDTIFGGGGNDRLTGNAGDDILDGGAGNDFLFGGLDNDLLWGGAGIDTLQGHYGNDVVLGGDDADQLFGGGDHDLLSGGLGLDRVRGDSGDDVVAGGASDLDDDVAAALAAMLLTEGETLGGADPAVALAVSEWFNNQNRAGFGSFDETDGIDDLSGDTGADQFFGLSDRIRNFRAGEDSTP